MQNFPEPQMDNIPGLAEFWYVPVRDVATVASAKNRIIDTLTLKTGKSFYKGYATIKTLQYTEPANQTVHGTLYQCQLQGRVPGDIPNSSLLFTQMEEDEFILVFRDRNKQFRILGDLRRGCRFKADYDSASGPDQPNGYQFGFRLDTTHKAYYFTDNITVYGSTELIKVCPEDVTLRLVFSDISDNEYTFTVTDKEVGLYVRQTLTNVASVTYLINGVADTIALNLVLGDVVNISFTRTTKFQESTIVLSES